MISECAFTAKPIYIFHLPFKRKSKRIKKFHEQFQGLNITKDLNSTNELLSWTYKPLDESKRIASIIKERIIKESQ
jgi:mitochondrial fission protein ELM1